MRTCTSHESYEVGPRPSSIESALRIARKLRRKGHTFRTGMKLGTSISDCSVINKSYKGPFTVSHVDSCLLSHSLAFLSSIDLTRLLLKPKTEPVSQLSTSIRRRFAYVLQHSAIICLVWDTTASKSRARNILLPTCRRIPSHNDYKSSGQADWRTFQEGKNYTLLIRHIRYIHPDYIMSSYKSVSRYCNCLPDTAYNWAAREHRRTFLQDRAYSPLTSDGQNNTRRRTMNSSQSRCDCCRFLASTRNTPTNQPACCKSQQRIENTLLRRCGHWTLQVRTMNSSQSRCDCCRFLASTRNSSTNQPACCKSQQRIENTLLRRSGHWTLQVHKMNSSRIYYDHWMIQDCTEGSMANQCDCCMILKIKKKNHTSSIIKFFYLDEWIASCCYLKVRNYRVSLITINMQWSEMKWRLLHHINGSLEKLGYRRHVSLIHRQEFRDGFSVSGAT
jgi:hypothetical protein